MKWNRGIGGFIYPRFRSTASRLLTVSTLARNFIIIFMISIIAFQTTKKARYLSGLRECGLHHKEIHIVNVA